jgi:hypothetical protein
MPQSSRQALSRRRGREFEKKIARVLGGHLYHQHDGDVTARGYRIECKQREGYRLQSTTELAEWMEQIRRYRKMNPGKKFAFAFTGGRAVRGETWVAVLLDEFERLTRQATTEEEGTDQDT